MKKGTPWQGMPDPKRRVPLRGGKIYRSGIIRKKETEEKGGSR